MSRYVAFLRAINVGGHTVRMTDLRRLFLGMGLSDVETFIASGNVAFSTTARSTARLERTIANSLHENLGYEVASFVRSVRDVARIAAATPFDQSDVDAAHALHVGFLAARPGQEALRKLQSASSPLNQFCVDGTELYWLCRTRASDSDISGATLEKILGMPATLRNINTVRRIADRVRA